MTPNKKAQVQAGAILVLAVSMVITMRIGAAAAFDLGLGHVMTLVFTLAGPLIVIAIAIAVLTVPWEAQIMSDDEMTAPDAYQRHPLILGRKVVQHVPWYIGVYTLPYMPVTLAHPVEKTYYHKYVFDGREQWVEVDEDEYVAYL